MSAIHQPMGCEGIEGVLLSRSGAMIGGGRALVKRRFGGGGVRSGFCVYLLHFPDGSHYTGYTGVGPIERLRRHLSGRGSGWVYRRAVRMGAPLLGVVEFQVTRSAAVKAERHYKRHSWKLRSRCVFCSPMARAGSASWGEEIGEGGSDVLEACEDGKGEVGAAGICVGGASDP